jgi:hypothetical protein
MAKEKINKEEIINEQIEEIVPDAIEIIRRKLKGMVVNNENLKAAQFTASLWKALKIQRKEAEKLELQKQRFAVNMITTFGDEGMKKEVKEVIKASLPKIKFFELEK